MNLTIIWEEFLTIIKEEVGSRVVETWFKAVALSHWDASKKIIYLQAPNAFIKQWISQHYLALLQTHLGRLFHEPRPTIIFVDAFTQSSSAPSLINKAPVVENFSVPQLATAVTEKEESRVLVRSPQKTKSVLNPHYVFDNFILGPSNQLAHSAAQAVANYPGTLYNPLFIYGNSGLGKTHLLHAIGNQVKSIKKKAVVLYQTADRFVNEFITAIRFDKIPLFEARYKEVDLLLIDDIQFISKKEQTQEAFFHIFNTLYDAHKQIVFTSDSFPRDIQGLAERLRTRLEGGMITDIQTPTLETKMAILKQKAESHGQELTDDVCYYIASCALYNVRELEGALIRVLAFASLTQQPITLEAAQKVLIRVQEAKKTPKSLKDIAALVAQFYAIKVADLRSIKRNQDLVLARHVAMYLMKKNTSASLIDIALFWHRKDHSTVIHALNKMEKKILEDTDFRLLVVDLEKRLFSES